jgi:SH3-like domain-containing protein
MRGILFAIFVGAAMAPAAWAQERAQEGAAPEAGGADDMPTVQAVTEPDADAPRIGQSTGLTLPRFASVRAGEAKLRTGPGLRYPTEWVYNLRNMPVEIVEEFEAWRKVRDWEGTEGWMHQSLLSGRRTVIVMAEETILRRDASAEAPGVARLTQGVLAELETCRDAWCLVAAGGHAGFVPRTALYGLLADETFAE